MEKMNSKKFISSTAEIFTLSLLFVSIFNIILSSESDNMRKLSVLFALCGEGLSFTALGELLVLSVIISALRSIWFSPRFFKNLLMLNRVTFMLVSVFLTSGICSVLFGWFPPSMWQAWLGFVLSFGIGTAVSFAVMFIRTRAESRKYQRNLTVYNDLHNREDE